MATEQPEQQSWTWNVTPITQEIFSDVTSTAFELDDAEAVEADFLELKAEFDQVVEERDMAQKDV